MNKIRKNLALFSILNAYYILTPYLSYADKVWYEGPLKGQEEKKISSNKQEKKPSLASQFSNLQQEAKQTVGYISSLKKEFLGLDHDLNGVTEKLVKMEMERIEKKEKLKVQSKAKNSEMGPSEAQNRRAQFIKIENECQEILKNRCSAIRSVLNIIHGKKSTSINNVVSMSQQGKNPLKSEITDKKKNGLVGIGIEAENLNTKIIKIINDLPPYQKIVHKLLQKAETLESNLKKQQKENFALYTKEMESVSLQLKGLADLLNPFLDECVIR